MKTNLEILEEEIIKYVEQNEVFPFANIDIKESGEIIVDVDKDFENKIKENITDIEETLGEYFTKVIKEKLKAVEDEELS